MRKIFFSLVILSSLISCQNSTQTKKEVTNPNEHLVMATLWYQRASECRALYYQAFNAAKLSLDKQLESYSGSKAKAVVVDIDETVLDNSPFETNSIRTGKTFTPKAWKEWTDMAKAQATPGSLEFLKYAESKGVETFYISNRDTSATKKTLQNLKELGFPFADKDHILLKSNTSIKTERRNKVSETHEILILAGDNIGDFDEILEDRSENYGFAKVDAMKDEFGGKFIVLPNPMYGSWEKEVLRSDTKLNATEKETLRKKRLIGYEDL
ncbi:5'-nucleotidase, lipoprotein e(P4) family [Marinifilum caeruleilacunae]|uniref:5'-nucleotidase, lipoprotein e(P4) family n=1 Tax=Marinifilum caeruleilacunae TaxID=2499076 RepID=A0ABX1WVA9_9BACT|nr:5'-nucleotidase, lipoprotein e(P4) family [Marinifilum caeruleilacunae]NOU59843.1 5'-nucleotidase, lipoprotein e(P4) family [Marinifilum caeruleilacunae]